MKIETRLALTILGKTKKRAIFTTISIALCTILIFTTMLLIYSIRNGITKNIENEYNDYHFAIKNLNINGFNKIKDKEYIDKIYIQEGNESQLKKLEKPYELTSIEDSFNVYIKYKNVRKTCENTTNILHILEEHKMTTINSENINNIEYEVNKKVLTVHGLIDVIIVQNNNVLECVSGINYTYVLDIMILVILVTFSVLFIIILHNSFLITINERKKEYAILNSVGGTEGQILKMLFLEAIIIGTVGIVIGGVLSTFGADIILKMLNSILEDAGYSFKLVFNDKYIISSLFIIVTNIYISAIIPSIKASTTSIIQGIRNNKEIKNKKRKSLLERILPVEGKAAIKNIKRTKSKYKIITILLVICMTSYIVVSTYINYEKKIADLVDEYDSDAQLFVKDSLIDYKALLKDYEEKTGDKAESVIEYKELGVNVLVEPSDAFINDESSDIILEDNKKGTKIVLMGVDDNSYNKYINKIKAKYGDIVIYNNRRLIDFEEKTYRYYKVFKQNYDFKLNIIDTKYIEQEIYDSNNYDEESFEDMGTFKYKIIDNENLNGKIVLTDELIDGCKDMQNSRYLAPIAIVNMETYNRIEKRFYDYFSNDKNISQFSAGRPGSSFVRVRCGNIIGFSNYIEDFIEKDMNKFENLNEYDDKIAGRYFTLQTKEKLVYINIIELILKVIILAIIIIGITSTVNIINASLSERKEEFNILNRIGATKGNINKMLIYEFVYMYLKAVVISIILSLPMIYGIIKYIENIIALDEILIPIGSICMFLGVLLLITLGIATYSTRIVKDK